MTIGGSPEPLPFEAGSWSDMNPVLASCYIVLGAAFRRRLIRQVRLAAAIMRRNAALVRLAVLEYLRATHYVGALIQMGF